MVFVMMTNNMYRNTPFRASQRGVGMIEILVGVIVIAVGLLGYAAMQLFALQNAEEASLRINASMLGRDAMERLYLLGEFDNDAGLNFYLDPDNWPDAAINDGGAFPVACVDGVNECDAAAFAAESIAQIAWIAGNTLPQGMVMLRDDCTGVPSPSCVVVSWGGTTPAQCLVNDEINTDDPCLVSEVRRP